MKTILIVRHAKSSWENFTVSDELRPLNDRGRKNATEMASRLMSKSITADELISSPAKRALTTAQIFAGGWKMDPKAILIVPALYNAQPEAFTAAIRNAMPAASTIALFSHNPVITDYVNQLTTTRIDSMPTCAVFAVKSDIGDWTEFQPSGNEFYFFDYPKSDRAKRG